MAKGARQGAHPADEDFDAEPEDESPVRRTRPRNRHVTNPDPRRHRSEAAIQSSLIERLRSRGHGIVTTGSRFLLTGTPDIIACVDGRTVVIEVKRPGEKPVPAQLGQLARWQRAGALAGWATSEEDLDALLVHLHDRDWLNDFASPGGP